MSIKAASDAMSQQSHPSLPHDIYQFYVLPNILSSCLHHHLVQSEPSGCQPFYTLPLVSSDFRNTCRNLCRHIFGLNDEESGSVIKKRLQHLRTLWNRANFPEQHSQHLNHPSCRSCLPPRNDLLQVYEYIALAKWSLNWITPDYIRSLEGVTNEAQTNNLDNKAMEMIKIRDDQHTVYGPLIRAIELCDRISPDLPVVVYTVSEYLASIVPMYSTAPMLLQCTQAIHTCIAWQGNESARSVTSGWITQTLDHIQKTEDLIQETVGTGVLVNSFARKSSIPLHVLSQYRVLEALRLVSKTRWNFTHEESEAIQRKALNLLELFMSRFQTEDSQLVDRSHDIVVWGEHPIAGGTNCDMYRGILKWGLNQTIPVALKKLRVFTSMTEEEQSYALKIFLREVRIWLHFKHSYILPSYGFAKRGEAELFLISPWMENGTCIQYFKQNPDADRIKLLLQVSEALGHLHSRGYVHSDIKGDNVMISDEGNAQLFDFGITRHVEPIVTASATPPGLTSTGNARFVAPELLFPPARPSFKSDVFAFGGLIVQIFTGKPPFPCITMDAQVISEVLRGHKSQRPKDPDLAVIGFGDTMWNLVEDCWNHEPSCRPTMDEIADRLKGLSQITHC
ncbi:kinase-like protein [Ramaria rubella]|nr:kinase-like protein [Ramaria rubella]